MKRNGDTILDAKTAPPPDPVRTPAAARNVHDNFTLALWAKPTADTTLAPGDECGCRVV